MRGMRESDKTDVWNSSGRESEREQGERVKWVQ